MKSMFFRRLRGYVGVRLYGQQLERLLNAMIEKRYEVWDIRHRGEAVDFRISLPDFFQLRALAKQTGCRVRLRIQERAGLPFQLDKWSNRKVFLAGVVCFFAAIYVLSMLVWHVDVEGNERLTRSDVLQAARESGIRPMQWKFRLPEPDKMSHELQTRLPGTAWVGVHIEGTRVHIHVVEGARPEDKPLASPRHLVASKDALVTQILAEKGKPLVKPNTNVSKGDILISGYIGNEVNGQTVVAEGVVRGIVWEEASVEIPLLQQQKVYTGEKKERFYLVFGNRALQVTGYGGIPFEQYESIPDRKAVGWRSWRLPFGWLTETIREARIEERLLDPQEAEQIALEQARAEVLTASGPDAKLRGEKIILHEKSDNGTVYMKVLFEVEQQIAVEQPIVPAT